MIQILHKTPFYRAALVMQAIHDVMVKYGISRAKASQMVPQYRSRGHGRKVLIWATNNPVSHCNNANVAPGTQGKRECTRRMRQLRASNQRVQS